ncbi:Trm112 family protein [uncultured Pontibacter sp.]|uniref:Trm112 family protein n=1 Tax=uncultured Pontibacter sp. TaxID=453356 RepID=UPI002603B427|nr:Trm112 family protein [uncultured Pontibacter sp.]
MNPSLLTKLCCPIDKHDLNAKVFTALENGDIQEGLLTCPVCRRYYPIIYGIPIMTPDEYREKALEAPLLEKWGLDLKIKDSQPFLLEG